MPKKPQQPAASPEDLTRDAREMKDHAIRTNERLSRLEGQVEHLNEHAVATTGRLDAFQAETRHSFQRVEQLVADSTRQVLVAITSVVGSVEALSEQVAAVAAQGSDHGDRLRNLENRMEFVERQLGPRPPT